MSRYYTLDEDTYPRFLHDNGEGGYLSLLIFHFAIFDLVLDCLFVYAEMDLFAFIHVMDPTKVKVVERERVKREPRFLDSTVGRVVPFLPVAPTRTEGELEASIDKLFDEGGKGDSAAGDHDVVIEPITDTEGHVDENVVAERPRHPPKRKPADTNAGGSFHPPKKLRWGHGTSSGAVTGGKSPSVIRKLLESSMLNVEAGVSVVATLPFVTSSVYATPKREADGVADSVSGPQLGPPARFVISSDSFHRSITNAAEVEVDSC
ncbi:hypothetical protein Tco_0095110, partial [Tanacetum coccineum]